MTLGDLLADNNFGDTRSGGLAGPMGLLLIIILGVATVLLIRNMSKRIRRLPSRFDSDAGEAGSEGQADLVEHVKSPEENSP